MSIRLALIAALLAAPVLTACETDEDPAAGLGAPGMARASALRAEAEQRCGALGVERNPKADGTSPGDYHCEGPGR